MSAWVAWFGFEARDMKVHHVPCQAVFLGCRPCPAMVEGREVATWVPTLGRRIVRLCTLLDPRPHVDGFAWLAGVVEAAQMSYNQLPFMNDFLARLSELNLSKQKTPAGPELDSRDAHKRMMFTAGATESRLAMAVMWEVYGLGWGERTQWQKLLRRVSRLPAMVVFPPLEGAIAHDT